MRKKILFLLLVLLWNLQGGIAQIDDSYVRDSIEIEKGVSGTTDFEPFFRVVNESFDENNRPLQSIVYSYISPTELEPYQRQTYQYNTAGSTTFFLLEEWEEVSENWAPLKQENSNYDNGRLSSLLRKLPVQGELQNHRRWSYEYTAQGGETLKQLQAWDQDTEMWNNLTRKITSYNMDGQILQQRLERFTDMAWENNRRRLWTWAAEQLQPTQTLGQVWSVSNQEWVNDSRKTFEMGANSLWSGSVVEQWNATTKEWINDVKETFVVDLLNNASNYTLESWNDEWQSDFRSQYAYTISENTALLQRWNDMDMQHENFLRYRSFFNNQYLPTQQTGMQAWNADTGNWQNEDFTRRISYFWRANDPSNIEELGHNYCKHPNPYFSGATINCELSTLDFPLSLEIYNLYGQVVLRKEVYSPSFHVNTSLLSKGLYVFKLADERQIYQLQKVVIAN